MTTSELEAMSIKQLQQLRAGSFPGSVRYDQVTPILEGKHRRADTRRAWVIAIIASTIALLGVVVSYFIRRK